MEIEKTLSLYSLSDLIFISYGERGNPHSRGLRLEPSLHLLAEAIRRTPQPNDFGIMPFNWRARSKEDILGILLDRKFSRWSISELFAYGYLILDRLLLDIDTGPISEEEALSLAEKLRKRGIGKVGYTGGGLLAVLELEFPVEVRDRKIFERMVRNLIPSVRKLVGRFDEGSLNAGKGVRLIGTYSEKRKVDTRWILWEEGKRFDPFLLIFGMEGRFLALAPQELKEKIREKFGVRVGTGNFRSVSVEELFEKAREFYGGLEGRRNDFLLKFAGELYSAGVEIEKVIDLYYEYLSDLETKDRPHIRVKQTIEWVYKEGKKYRLSEEECPREFLLLVRAFRKEEASLSWREFCKRVPLSAFRHLLEVLGEGYRADEEFFHPPSGFYYGKLKCRWIERDEERGEIKREDRRVLNIIMTLPPCIREALDEYERVEDGNTEWYAENLVQVSFLLPDESFETDEEVEELLDNPLSRAVCVMTSAKGISRGEVKIENAKRKVMRKHDGVWNLVRCMNPLLKQKCREDCACYRFRQSLPEVVKRVVNLKTGEVEEAVIRIEGEELRVSGSVLRNVRSFSGFLEKRGYFLPRISVE